MSITVICQAGRWLRRLPPVAALFLTGCLQLSDRLPPPWPGEAPAGFPAAPAEAGSAWPLLLGCLALAGLAVAWRRLRREGSERLGLDREDLALLRTARDALAILLRKKRTAAGGRLPRPVAGPRPEPPHGLTPPG